MFIPCIVLLSFTATITKASSWYQPPSKNNSLELIYRDIGGNSSAHHFRSLIANLSLGDDVTSFRWSTVTGFRSSPSSSWVVLGGSVGADSTGTFNVLPKRKVAVIACELHHSAHSLSGIQFKTCQRLESDEITSVSPGPTLMGATLSSLSLGDEGALLIYCDPLWRSSAGYPIGKCTQRLRRLETWSSKREASFHMCSASPCASGLSLDLTQHKSKMSNNNISEDDQHRVSLLLGLPHGLPTGEVRVIDHLLRHFNYDKNEFERSYSFGRNLIANHQYGFGTKVAWTPVPVVANLAPELPSSSNRLSWANDGQFILATSSSNLNIYQLTEAAGNVVLELGPTSDDSKTIFSEDAFAGFGMALESVRLATRSAILIGAPYAKSAGMVNSGRVYVVCPATAFGSNNGTAKVSHVNGSRANSLFGYSIARIGDIDGDGLDDVAIGAPGLGGSAPRGEEANAKWDGQHAAPGEVFLYRMTEKCELDEKPLQVLQSPLSSPNDGFGIDITRGFDIDSDKSPEFAVTSLRANVGPAVFTMPRRLKAKCFISSPSLASIKKASTLTVSFSINLIDEYTKKAINIPDGVASSTARIHQINPDVAWQQHVDNQLRDQPDSTTDHGNKNLLFAIDIGSISDADPRFIVLRQTVTRTKPRTLHVESTLQALYDAPQLHLASIGLRVAYRSIIDPDGPCSLKSGVVIADTLCSKVNQPLIDWTECAADLDVGQPRCPGRQRCSADLEITAIALVDGEGHSETLTDPFRLVKFGDQRAKLPQQFKVSLVNRGPTKGQGVGVQVKTIGNHGYGIRLRLIDIKVTKKGKDVTSKWLIKVSSNEELGLAKIRSDWVFPGDAYELSISFEFDGLDNNDESISRDFQPCKLREFNASKIVPSLEVRVISGVEDPDETNNKLVQAFKIKYEPYVVISMLSQPKTVIDHRLKPTKIFKGMRLSSSDLGPFLKHGFLVENRGNVNLAGITFALEFPFETLHNDPLVYLVENVKVHVNGTALWKRNIPQVVGSDGRSRGECFLPSSFYNPLGLTVFTPYTTRGGETLYESKPDVDQSADSEIDGFYKLACENPRPSNSRQRGRLSLSCTHPEDRNLYAPSGRHLGLKVLCRLDQLPRGDAVRLTWTGWFWAATAFKLHKSDIELTSRLSLTSWGQLPASLCIYPDDLVKRFVNFAPILPRPSNVSVQRLVFPAIKPRLLDNLPLWQIVVGVVIGLLILACISVLGYCCGWFRRRRSPWQQEAGAAAPPERQPSVLAPVAGDPMSRSSQRLVKHSPNLQRAESPQPPDMH